MKIRKGPAHKAGPFILSPFLPVKSLRGLVNLRLKSALTGRRGATTLKNQEYLLVSVWKGGESDPTNQPYERRRPMSDTKIRTRLMKAEDFDAVVAIDEKVLKVSRPEYYKQKFEKLVQSKDYIPTSLVAEAEEGTVVGFVLGELFIGEYGITQETATLDTIGVDPTHQHKGIGELLIQEFMDHLRTLGVHQINTLVDWNDIQLIHFFSVNHFSPSKRVNLVRNI